MIPEAQAKDVTSVITEGDNGWRPVFGFRHRNCGGFVSTDGEKWHCECGFETGDGFTKNFCPIKVKLSDI